MNYPLFHGAGFYLYNPEVAMDQREFVKRFQDAGGTWMAFLLQQGVVRVQNSKNNQLISICKEFGIKVVGSSWLTDNPAEEAKISKELAVGLDGWIANGEQPIAYSQPWGFCPQCFNYSSQWMASWAMMRETLFSSYTHFNLHDIDYKPFVQQGCFAGPQAYKNDFGPSYGPDDAIPAAYNVNQPWNGYRGFDSDRIAPVAGIHASAYPVDFPGWISDLRDIRLRYPGHGFSVWPGELFRNVPSGWTLLENAIKGMKLARYPGDEISHPDKPLTAEELPHTGPYYGPTTNKPKRKGNTAKALKMTMHRGGFGYFPNPDFHYNLLLEQAIRRFQHAKKISPASGNYGLLTWKAIRSALLPNGKLMIPEEARKLIRDEAAAN